MYYTEYTKLQRIHEKRNMDKFKEAYYEAIITMINNSNHLPWLLGYIQQYQGNGCFQIENNKVSLDNLQMVNTDKFQGKQVSRKRERSESSDFSQNKVQKTDSIADSEQASNRQMLGDQNDETISENVA